MKYDVIIIGGGLGGLACGSILARAGQHVLVLEQGRQAGGCLQSFRRGKTTYDTGFHYVGGLGEGQSLRAAFDYLGLMRLHWHRLDSDGFDRVMIGEREFRFAEGLDQFVETLAQDFPKERQGLQHYAEQLRRLDSETIGTGAYDFLAKTFSDPLLVNVLAGNALKMELRRESLPLFTFLHGQAPYIESSWRLRGDAGQMANCLVSNIRACGGDVCCSQRVQALTLKDERLTAAVTERQTYEADTFVSSIHPAAACQLVSPALRGIYPRRIAALENTGGMLTVQLRLRPKTVSYFNWNEYIYPSPSVWESADGVMVSCRVPADGLWAEQIDLLTPLSWSRLQPWEHTTVGQRGDDYHALKQRLADKCITLAERFLPNLSENIVSRYVSTPLTWRDYTLTPLGSAYGIRKDYRQPLSTMLSVRTPVANLLLTGQSLMVHGIQGTVMTALHTCAEILGHDYIRQTILR